MRSVLTAAGLLCFVLLAGHLPWKSKTVGLQNEAIRGGALHGKDSLYTWGDKLRVWSLPALETRVTGKGNFGEAGCLVDLDGDGRPEFTGHVGGSSGKLVWIPPDTNSQEVIDSGVETADCSGATLFGRKGVLTVHRYSQVRFYERPEHKSGRWPYREIYSFYTPSQQAGLLLQDIDRDGFTDIICGNYWIKSPTQFDLPWRLFAINTYSEHPLSAMSSFVSALPDGPLFIAQGHMKNGRVAAFEKPDDPRKIWMEERLEGQLNLMQPHGIALIDGGLLLGEHNGSNSRLIFFDDSAKGSTPRVIARGTDILAIFPLEGTQILTVGGDNVTLWSR
jgi:hypothetical protein